jgi:hypothetical protein
MGGCTMGELCTTPGDTRRGTGRVIGIGVLATATITVATGMHGHGGQLLSALSSSRLGIFQPMGPDIATSAQAMASIIADTIIAVGGGSF